MGFWSNSGKNQIKAALIANIGATLLGSGLGWISPALIILQSNQSPLATGPLTVDQTAYLASLMTGFASVFGMPIAWITKYIGLKRTILFGIVPSTISWLLIITTQSIEYLYVARILGGLTISIVFNIPLYVAEIAEPRIRGRLAALFYIFVYFGVSSSIAIGSYLPYKISPMVLLLFPIVFGIGFSLMPDTPRFLYSQGRVMEAQKSLEYYRNAQTDSMDDIQRIRIELESIKKYVELQAEAPKLTIKDFTNAEARKGIAVSSCLGILGAFCGNMAMVSYSSTILRDAGVQLNVAASATIVTYIQFSGTLLSSILIDCIGRKYLLMLSCLGCAAGHISLGAYNYLAINGIDVSEWKFVPVASLSIALFSSCGGILPLTAIIPPEVLPNKIRLPMSHFSFVLLNLAITISNIAYPILSALWNIYICLWIFGSFCILGFIYAIFYVSDTTGKNLY